MAEKLIFQEMMKAIFTEDLLKLGHHFWEENNVKRKTI